MKHTKPKLLALGIFNLAAPIPMILAICVVNILILSLGRINAMPGMILLAAILPVCQVLGIVLGILRRKQPRSILCLVFSAIGLVCYGGLWFWLIYSGINIS